MFRVTPSPSGQEYLKVALSLKQVCTFVIRVREMGLSFKGR